MYIINKLTAVVMFCAVLTGTLTLSGCARQKINGLVQAEGTVLYDEIPLPWASLSFLPENAGGGSSRLGNAMTDENGHFIVRTQGCNGILPGEYLVAVEKYVPDKGKNTLKEWLENRKSSQIKEEKPEETYKVVSVLPLKFSDANKSGLKVTIGSEGDKSLTIAFGNQRTK